MMTSITAAVAAAALVIILTAIGTLLVRASRWPDPVLEHKHLLDAHPEGYRPRPWDEVTSETSLSDAYVNDTQDVTPVSAPPVAEEPVDELDPRWDWRAYADAQEQEQEQEQELVAA
jgi:hypothetical protein